MRWKNKKNLLMPPPKERGVKITKIKENKEFLWLKYYDTNTGASVIEKVRKVGR